MCVCLCEGDICDEVLLWFDVLCVDILLNNACIGLSKVSRTNRTSSWAYEEEDTCKKRQNNNK